jgi:hypothetical protein
MQEGVGLRVHPWVEHIGDHGEARDVFMHAFDSSHPFMAKSVTSMVPP